MLQLPVIIILLISTFVGRVSPVLQKEDHEKPKVDLVSDLTNTSGKVVEPMIKPTDGKKENVPEGKVSTPTKSPTTVDVITPISVQKSTKNATENCTSTKEPEDMLGCNVTPTDDDDAIEKNLSVNSTEPTITVATIVSNKAETKAVTEAETKAETTAKTTVETTAKTTAETSAKTTAETTAKTTAETTAKTTAKTEVPNIPSQKDRENGQENDIVIINSTESADRVSYDVVPMETNHPLNITNSDIASAGTKHDDNTSEVPIVPTPPLVDKAAASTGTQDVVEAVKSTGQSDNKRMSSGIIALVTAITFAVVIAMVYIGMIVWRRYIEYRYGHRELLVNELEFDTNDLRHFEL